MRTAMKRRIVALGFVALPVSASFVAPSGAATSDPVYRPAARAQSLAALTGGGPLSVPCLTPAILALKQDPKAGTTPARRALSLLTGESAIPGERRASAADGVVVRYSMDRSTFDRIDPTDADADGQPDVLEAVLRGLADARRLLVQYLGLKPPGPLEVLLVRTAPSAEGYLIPQPSRDFRASIVVDAAARGGAEGIRRMVVHQYAHAVALAAGPAMRPALSEAFATWAGMRSAGAGPDATTLRSLRARLDGLPRGMAEDDFDLAEGNAAWFAFLEEAHGPTALAIATEEMAAGSSAHDSIDRALRRVAGCAFEKAFREFHLWSLLVGDRADGRHFTFAESLPSPAFDGIADGLPALSVRSDPPVSPLGAVRILVRPQRTDGGVTVRFEGEPGAQWDADLIVFGPRKAIHRIAMPLAEGSRGEMTIPLNGDVEIVLLARSLETGGPAARRYTWSAHHERGFPFEMASLEATRAEDGGGVLVSWETSAERGLAGFNIVRRREGTDEEFRVNPIWIPSVGDTEKPVLYRFLDDTAEPGVRYAYRIEGITLEGLSSLSGPAFCGTPSR